MFNTLRCKFDLDNLTLQEFQQIVLDERYYTYETGVILRDIDFDFKEISPVATGCVELSTTTTVNDAVYNLLSNILFEDVETLCVHLCYRGLTCELTIHHTSNKFVEEDFISPFSDFSKNLALCILVDLSNSSNMELACGYCYSDNSFIRFIENTDEGIYVTVTECTQGEDDNTQNIMNVNGNSVYTLISSLSHGIYMKLTSSSIRCIKVEFRDTNTYRVKLMLPAEYSQRWIIDSYIVNDKAQVDIHNTPTQLAMLAIAYYIYKVCGKNLYSQIEQLIIDCTK